MEKSHKTPPVPLDASGTIRQLGQEMLLEVDVTDPVGHLSRGYLLLATEADGLQTELISKVDQAVSLSGQWQPHPDPANSGLLVVTAISQAP